MSSPHQLQPSEDVSTAEQELIKDLPVFSKTVLDYQGKVTSEDSSSAELPTSYPYRTRLSRKAYEAEKIATD
jgi:hypothetical protein